jgi:glutamate-1-semialdehyde aminotransferase
VREETRRVGAVLVFDEIKTGFRVALGGAAARWGGEPDLIVLGKALANGYPLAAVGGPVKLMSKTRETWISSTLATEFVSFAAASAVVQVAKEANLRAARGRRKAFAGMEKLAAMRSSHRAAQRILKCVLGSDEEDRPRAVCAPRHAVQRTAYNLSPGAR